MSGIAPKPHKHPTGSIARLVPRWRVRPTTTALRSCGRDVEEELPGGREGKLTLGNRPDIHRLLRTGLAKLWSN